MTFPPRELAPFDAALEVRIETSAPDGPPHSTIIWAMVDGDQLYVRSVRGVTARWYREAIANPNVALVDDTARLTATAVNISDPRVNERVSDLLNAKYAGLEGLEEMLVPEAVQATLRLDPRA